VKEIGAARRPAGGSNRIGKGEKVGQPCGLPQVAPGRATTLLFGQTLRGPSAIWGRRLI